MSLPFLVTIDDGQVTTSQYWDLDFPDAGQERRYESNAVIPQSRLLRGRVYFDEEQYAKAMQAFATADETGNESIRDDAGYWMAKCRLRQGNFDDVIDRL